MNERKVVILSAVRTPIGAFCGSFTAMKASDLGGVVIKESLARAGLKPEEVSEVMIGQTLTAGQGQNVARQAAMKGGIPSVVPAYQINMLCGSGLKAVTNAYISIKCGENEVVVAGGQENMTQAPHATYLRTPVKSGNSSLIDTMLHDGLTDAFYNIHMGVTAENVAKKYQINRREQDLFALESQKKVATAICAGHFDKELIPVTVPNKKGPSTTLSKDEHPRPGTSMEFLEKLRTIFVKTDGTVTGGNSSGVNDGAAALVLTSEEFARVKQLPPMAHIVAIAQNGLDPKLMGMGPVTAIETVLQKANWTKEEVDLYEINEAFAAQAVACIQKLGIDSKKVNIHGGAISLGHPIGASGARILVTLLHALQRISASKGVAALCIGGGMGIAIAVERK